MNSGQLRIAVIKGDGIGVDVTNATLAVIMNPTTCTGVVQSAAMG